MGSVPFSAGNGKSLYFYATGDTVANILAANYWNNATKQLRKGDVIIASCVNGGTPTCTALNVTSADNAAAVTVAVMVFA
ncbi:hypothetical protein AC629_42450 [Bradyrhizobium sp. NAS80.1]|nr:hypothetical protein AC629_42450 [Bradyrhizobium sp. NAS80.1]